MVWEPSRPFAYRVGNNAAIHVAQSYFRTELCSQCFFRCAGALEVVYVEFPDKDKLADLHGGRQNSTNKMRNCPKYISELSGDEKVTWKTALQRMRRDGTLTNMYREFAKEHYGP